MARVRNQCLQSDPAWAAGPLGISAGIVEFDASETTEAFVLRADLAMYRAKARGGST